MHLILCSSSDYSALWAYEGLRSLGLDSIELVTDDMLAGSTLWDHRIEGGEIVTEFTLPDGRVIASGDIGGVLNRLVAPPEVLVKQAVPADQEYVRQELTALYLSWLYAIPAPVINRPTPQGLAGRWRHAAEWAMIANESGFKAPAYRQTIFDEPGRGYASLAPADAVVISALILEGEVFGALLPPKVNQSCKRLAELSDTGLLGIDMFATPDDPYTFAWATPLPDLQLGSHALLSKLGQIFQHRGNP